MSSVSWYQKTGWIIGLLFLFPPLGIFLTWKYGRWQRNTKIVATVVSSIFFVFVLANNQHPPAPKETQQTKQNPIHAPSNSTSAERAAMVKKPEKKQATPVDSPEDSKSKQVQTNRRDVNLSGMYRIISEKDLSMKALSRPLSSYSIAEIRALPTNVRKEYRIVVPSTISRHDLQESMKHVVFAATKANPDIDEIVIFAYDREEDSDDAFTYGKMEWCPEGRWDGVTPEIAASNDRSTYRFVFDIRDKVGHVTNDLKPTAKEYQMYDALDKALWANPNEDENVIKKRVAKKLGVSVKRLVKAYMKVVTYNLK